MKYCLFISSSPLTRQGSLSAYLFCCAALKQGHMIQQVFFYQDGVINALIKPDFPEDEKNLNLDWNNLAKNNNLSLTCCNASAARRGIYNDNISSNFTLAGLGQLIESLNQVDRTLVFN